LEDALKALQWIRADFDGDLIEVSSKSAEILSDQQSQMKLWRARLRNLIAVQGPPSNPSNAPIHQDCIEQAQIILSDTDKGYLVSLHQVEVHDWNHVGTRNSLHTSQVLGRIKGTIYAMVAPYESPEEKKKKLLELQEMPQPARQIVSDEAIKPEFTSAEYQPPQNNLNKEAPSGHNVQPNEAFEETKSHPELEQSPIEPIKLTNECSGCNVWLTLWVGLSVWFLCDWKMALIAVVPLLIRCIFNTAPVQSVTKNYDWMASFFIVALAWAMSFYGYRWVQETRCDELHPWWLWVIGLLIFLTRYLRTCIPWVLVVLIWNFSLVMVCRAEGQSCMLGENNDDGYISSVYDKVTQNIREILDRDANTQIATSLPTSDLKGGRISIDQALSNTDKFFTCPTDGSPAPKYNIYFGQGAIFGSADTTISPEARPHLRKLVTLLKRRPNDEIIITGHADKTGSSLGNMKLSEKRAYALADWLVELQAIKPDRITAVGAGDLDPLINLNTDIPLNRRVEVRINCNKTKG
jgi:outer membrane protein OmpA-like peptidoglycan-associated protein